MKSEKQLRRHLPFPLRFHYSMAGPDTTQCLIYKLCTVFRWGVSGLLKTEHRSSLFLLQTIVGGRWAISVAETKYKVVKLTVKLREPSWQLPTYENLQSPKMTHSI